MSKSFKKSPVVTLGNTKGMKRIANKTVRQKNKQNIIQGKELDIKNGKRYKKEFSSYDICDYKDYSQLGKSKRQIKEKAKNDKQYKKWYVSK